MRNLFLGFAVALLLALIGVLMYANRCKDPTKFEVVMIQLRCAQAIDSDSFTIEACNKFHGTPKCEFVDADGEPLTDLFFEHINRCARATLKDKNLCVDKYKDM